MKQAIVAALTVLAFWPGPTARCDDPPWPMPVAGHVAPRPGEHPRLFFRQADLPELRKRAQTREGRMLVDRTRFLLDGAEKVREAPDYTLWDGAAFGFLYQMTREQRYAELAAKSVDKAWAGATDSDPRYSLKPPGEPLRNGMALAAMAVAYDLCYDAWTPEYRKDQAQRIINWGGRAKTKGGQVSLRQLALAPVNPNPISNHFGLQVGGAGLVILALRGDAELDAGQHKLLDDYQKGVDKGMRKLFTYDFGDGGYFGEHAGPGVIATTWTVLPYLLADRVAGGRNWISHPKYPAPQWITLRFPMQLIPTAEAPMYPNISPGRGGYGGDILEQNGGHHATYFSQGFGAVEDRHKPGMLWVYENFVEPLEARQYKDAIPAGQRTFDAFNYPHRPMMAFVNWPWGVKAENPEKVFPKVKADHRFGQFIFRNRWKDGDDIVVAALFGGRSSDGGDRRLMVWGLGQRLTFGSVRAVVRGSSRVGEAAIDASDARVDGSGSVSAGGTTLGVDYSRASGTDALVVLVGPAANGRLGGAADPARTRVQSIEVAGRRYSILTLSADGRHPEAAEVDGKVKLGGQTFSLEGRLIEFTVRSNALK